MKTHNKRVLAAATLAAAIVAPLVGCSGPTIAGDKSQTHTVNVGIVQLSLFAPIYVAQAKGYFKDEGLEINLQNVKSGQDAIPLASSGKLDVVAAGISAGMFNAINTGLNVKIVASMDVAAGPHEDPTAALIVSKKEYDSGKITTVADLKGKKIGALGGSGATSAFYVSLALEEAGLTARDVTFVNISTPDIPTAIKTGGVDAGFLPVPFWINSVTEGEGVKMWQPPQGVSGTSMIYGGQFIDSELAQPFFNAVARAAQDLQGDAVYDENNLKIIAAATDQAPEVLAKLPLSRWLPNLAPQPEVLTKMQQVWSDAGALDYETPLDASVIVDPSFSENVG